MTSLKSDTLTAQEMVQRLLDAGHTPDSISEGIGNRVSSRTIYRWKNGQTEPQQQSDLTALKRYYSKAMRAVPWSPEVDLTGDTAENGAEGGVEAAAETQAEAESEAETDTASPESTAT
jgi:hypothetical protein